MSLFLGSMLVAGVEGAQSTRRPSEEDGARRRELASSSRGAARGSDGSTRLRRTVLKGQAATDAGAARKRMLKKKRTPPSQTEPISHKELRLISEDNGPDWEATVEEMAQALREAKKNKHKDACGVECKQCWNALGGKLNDVKYNLERMTHLIRGAWYQVSFCPLPAGDVAACKSAFDFMLTNAGLGLLEASQTDTVPVTEEMCHPQEQNVFKLMCTKRGNGDTAKIAHSLDVCREDTVTLNHDFRAKCETSFEFLGGDIVAVKKSLDIAKELYAEKYTGDECGDGPGYGVLFCPNGEPKNLLQIQSVLEAFWYLSFARLNEEHQQGAAEYPGMDYWKDSGGEPADYGLRLMSCE